MNFLSIFDVIGPNMIGPSSSHTAGAVAIGLLARKMLAEEVKEVTFTLYGSFSKTYHGHGTDRALLGGVLGFATDDERIRDAFDHATERGVSYKYVIDEETLTDHPNTADIDMIGISGHTLSIRGESIGGGKIRIARINNIDVDFTGEYSTLIVQQVDVPGVIAHITQCLSDKQINIAFLRLFRDGKGAKAFTVVESDEPITENVLEEIKQNPNIMDVMLIQM
ncbi:MAG TPA: L-serine ammonia-lyase, iron-sulfur-dependent, subunit beta [Lachnospiraceae bacterium]|nr:L-serine ammonia-lyase, iron-sulfur-dependent, subunit beta [Lachnospiraceae bacterium]